MASLRCEHGRAVQADAWMRRLLSIVDRDGASSPTSPFEHCYYWYCCCCCDDHDCCGRHGSGHYSALRCDHDRDWRQQQPSGRDYCERPRMAVPRYCCAPERSTFLILNFQKISKQNADKSLSRGEGRKGAWEKVLLIWGFFLK